MQDHHTGSVELCFSPQYAEEAFQDAHMERKASVRAVRRRGDPDHAGQEARARGRRTCSRCSRSGCPTTGTHEPHRDELEQYARPDLRPVHELAPNFKDCGHRPPGDRAVRHGAGARADRGQHLPRRALGGSALPHASGARATRTTARRCKGLYHGSSATHAGGGVNGIPGWQAYRAADEGPGGRKKSRGDDPATRRARPTPRAHARGAVGRRRRRERSREGSVGDQSVVELRRGGFDGRDLSR